MKGDLYVYNTLSRKKEKFEPINDPFVGLYVCGPTVYSDVHIGNCRTFISFDIIYRYLLYLGYKVRYVRNITDVGHLENDADEGEDKIAKKAKLDNIEPMEVVQKYTNGFHDVMSNFNTLCPSVEPSATGHMVEQIEIVQTIIDKGFAYESNGSVYFDLEKYSESNNYGDLSGRKLDELQVATRASLDGQSDKKSALDFVIWKKASPEHLMQWNSPWGKGFPGWHLECSVMSTKYLGEQFDIHGGGMDLKFPHHECEIAQNVAATGKQPVKYWLHTNMLTLEGEKMSKSTGRFFLPNQLFTGESEFVQKPFSPMVVRFFMMQCHYRSTLDFSNDALLAAEKGFNKLMNALNTLKNLSVSDASTIDVSAYSKKCFAALNDDFNTPIAIATLFDLVREINSAKDGKGSVNEGDKKELIQLMEDLLFSIMGLKEESEAVTDDGLTEDLMQLLIELRSNAKKNKDFDTADAIRNKLTELNVVLKDSRDGTEWSKN